MYQDHPRMRGVHLAFSLLNGFLEGSSPHARGPFFAVGPLCDNCRIIPACAGSMPERGCDFCNVRDHPRMRGVHSEQHHKRRWKLGSSPHARGPSFAVGIADRL